MVQSVARNLARVLTSSEEVQRKQVKTQVLSVNIVHWTTCFGFLGGHHQVQQTIGDNIFHGIELLDVDISLSVFCMAIHREKLWGP